MFFASRGLRDVFFIHGTSVGFYPTLAYTAGMLAPYCLLVGFLLPYSLFVLRAGHQGYPGAFVYMTDNLGGVAGGAFSPSPWSSSSRRFRRFSSPTCRFSASAGTWRDPAAASNPRPCWPQAPRSASSGRGFRGASIARHQRGAACPLPGVPPRPHHGFQGVGSSTPCSATACRC